MRHVLVACLALAACAKPHLGVRADTPPPPPATSAGTFEGAGGTRLYERAWRPDGEPRGVLVVMHGLRDHGDRYAEVAETLVARGYAVHAFDLRGHGRSAGRRVTIGSFDEYVEDLDRFVARVREREPGRPLFVFGHSMGGAIVALWTATRRPDVAGVVLSAPALRIDAPPLQAAATPVLAALAPELGALAPDNRHFSSDPAIERAMGADPLIHQPPGPVHTARGLLGAIERIWASTDRLTAPLLLLHGTADRLTAPAGSRDLYVRAAATDKTLRLYEGAAHDLVHEPARARIVADLVAWMDERTGGPPAAFGDAPVPRRLRGDRRHPSASVAAELAYRRTDEDAPAQVAGGGVRTRWLLGRRPSWALGLDAELLGGDALRYRAAAYPLGVGLVRPGGVIALVVGGGVVDPGADAAFEGSAVLDVEAQLGPVRLLGWARAAWVPEDELQSGHAGAAVRLGRSHRYWSTTHAGAGPYLGVTVDRAAGVTTLGVALGLHLWGGTW